MKVETIVSLALLGAANAFAPSSIQQRQSTQLKFGIPTFGAGKDKEEKETAASTSNEPEKKINFSGLVQLITAGMGSPFLGNFEGVDEETGKMMFSLEANNLVDEVSIVHSVGILQHSTVAGLMNTGFKTNMYFPSILFPAISIREFECSQCDFIKLYFLIGWKEQTDEYAIL